ncbi:hypothetical protein BB561_005232 [Smittium simulii]|uniref:BOD1/SHG1 domain-containing protein n=1 Tax=Smittium simulii TaxID=133385 RepID=A0A2T9YBH3_9FUNG|nr:hypothetical protein BB561_005232 [Smittium simulii]
MENAVEDISREIKRCGAFDTFRQQILKDFENSSEYQEFYQNVERAYERVYHSGEQSQNLIKIENSIDKYLEKNQEWRNLRYRTKKKLKNDRNFTKSMNAKIANSIIALEKAGDLKFLPQKAAKLSNKQNDFNPKNSPDSLYPKYKIYDQVKDGAIEFDLDFKMVYSLAGDLENKNELNVGQEILVTRSDFGVGISNHHYVSHFKKATIIEIQKQKQQVIVKIGTDINPINCDNFVNSNQIPDNIMSTLAFW